MIDDSSAFRMDPDVPLVVPEVNPDAARAHKGIIAGPNCSTAQMVVVLQPLQRRGRPQARGRGHLPGGLRRREGGDGRIDRPQPAVPGRRAPGPGEPPQSLAFNIFPHIDSFRDDGYTKEEWKMLVETRKIMGLPDLRLSATCVRVPVAVGHSEALHIEFERPMSAARGARDPRERPRDRGGGRSAQSRSILSRSTRPAATRSTWAGSATDVSNPGGIALWVVADNLRKGAALNAVQIAELLYGAAAPAPAEGAQRRPL